MPLLLRGSSFEIKRVNESDIPAILEVYRQCEDFLALGPVPYASLPMVLKDLEISRDAGGIFCGIYDLTGQMMGIVDYVPAGFEGNPRYAFLELLMIAAPYRGHGLGAEVVSLVEAEIARNSAIEAILSGVQVNNPAAIRFWQRRGYQIVGEPQLFPDQTTAYPLQKKIHRESAGRC